MTWQRMSFSDVGVERDFRPLKHLEQLRFVGIKPRQQTVESDEAGAAREDAVEPGAKRRLALFARSAAVGLEFAVEPPDRGAQLLLGSAVLLGESVELVHEALGMNPA